LAAAALSAGCQGVSTDAAATRKGGEHVEGHPAPKDAAPDPSGQERHTDPELETGLMLRSIDDGNWGLRVAFPVSIGLTDFDLDTGISLDNLATVSVVPTLEFIVPIDDRWTLLPFVGVGGAVALGEQAATSGENAIGLMNGGLRIQRWQPFAERYVSVLTMETRYSATLPRRDGLLGDWGWLTGAAEIRRSFGASHDGPRFQAGIYAQAFWFWDPIEFEIEGVTPTFLHNQREFGISLGSSEPFSIWGINLPRVFLGFRVGGGVQSVQIRFGRL